MQSLNQKGSYAEVEQISMHTTRDYIMRFVFYKCLSSEGWDEVFVFNFLESGGRKAGLWFLISVWGAKVSFFKRSGTITVSNGFAWSFYAVRFSRLYNSQFSNLNHASLSLKKLSWTTKVSFLERLTILLTNNCSFHRIFSSLTVF